MTGRRPCRIATAIGVVAGALATVEMPQARAGAWPELAGHWLAIETFSDYRAAVQGYNQFGQPTGTGRYTQYEFAPYIEYGLSPRWTIGFEPRSQVVVQSGLPGTRGATGLVQINLWARYEVFRDAWNVVSVQGQVGFPGVQTPQPPALAQPGAEYEARALFGHAFRLADGWTGYTDLETGYRIEVDGWADQIRADGTLGIRPVQRWMFLAQTFNTLSVGQAAPGGSDYNLYRVALSVVHKVTPHIALQLGVWRDIGGRNIALGNAGFAAIWLRF